MCGRFILSSPSKIPVRFKITNPMPLFKPSYNISPGSYTPVITKNSPKKCILMKWGLIPFWAKDPKIGFRMINARSEDIDNKPAFRVPIRTHRCLIPSNGFYEWMKIKLEEREEKIPWFIGFKDMRIFSMAGIYDIWKDSEGKEIYSYSIITTNAQGRIRKIHDRTPAILDEENEEIWLSEETPLAGILKLLVPYDTKLISYPISKLVNNPENDSKELIQEYKYPKSI